MNLKNVFPKRTLSLLFGLVVFILVLILPPPSGMAHKAWYMVGIVSLIAIWWITEALELSVTALLPIVLLPIMEITPVSTVTLSYANEAIFLFMGGFMIAIAMERSQLHKRFALHTIYLIGSSPARIILGFMVAVYVLSMWVSNTATVLMVIPICLAIVHRFADGKSDSTEYLPFIKALLLSVAYAASIGGVATLIGTPPNIVFASIASRTPGMEISFAGWMLFAFPVTLILLFLVWLLVVYVLCPMKHITIPLGKETVKAQIEELGPMTTHEKRILVIFTCIASLWVFRGIVPWQFFHSVISDTTIAIAGAIVLFIIPTGMKKGERLLDWQGASGLPWNILLLFGGGLALSAGFSDSGLSNYLVTAFESLQNLDTWVLLLVIITAVIFLTELMSNTATATLLIPIMISVSEAFGISPLILTIPITMSTSFAFMLPVATPPNAIVFGYNYLTVKDMASAGFWVNITCIVVMLIASLFFLPVLIGG